MGKQELPEGWIWTTIDEITQPIEKVQPKNNPEADFIYLDISSIDNKRFIIVEPKHYIGKEAPSRARQLVKAQDILFSTVRTYLMNIAQVPDVYDGQIASTGFSVLRPEVGISPKYLFYYCLTSEFLTPLEKLQRGTSYPAVRDGDVRDQTFPLAPLAEQQRIVDEIEAQFTRLEAGVAALKRAQANLKRYRASVLKAACEGRLVPQDPADEPAGVLLERILRERREIWEAEQWQKEIVKAQKKAAKAKRKAIGLSTRINDIHPEEWLSLSEAEYTQFLPGEEWESGYKHPQSPEAHRLNSLPEGWIWATWEQVGFCQNGRAFPSKYYQSDGVKLLRPGNLYPNGMIVWTEENTRHMPKEWAEDYPEHVVRGNELIINLTAQSLADEFLGRVCFTDSGEYCLLNQRLARLTPVGLNSKYLLYMFKSEVFRRFVASLNTGSLIQHMFTSQIYEFVLPIPPLAEQQRIVEEVERRLSVVEEVEAALETNLKRAERLRQAILKRAFEGKLVPQNPADEPASVLLKRINQAKGGAKGKK